ncbi:hypothetical protein FQN51_005891 [Onygenales sp. PD_10]|nr:hypothetical protein FQN51_005891 [Onygenales sp. PD_10]
MGGEDGLARRDLTNDRLVVQQYASYSPAADPGLQNTPPARASQSKGDPAMSPPLNRRGTPRSLQPSPRDSRSGIMRTPGPHSAASVSPAFSAASAERPGESGIVAEFRSLPSPDLSDATIDDAYVAFIFYCNPNVPSGTDTAELRRIFRSPPRSEGKSFNIFTLWQLIQKLDRKELKTWIQLAIELGVDPPSAEKKQSTQKVQQYAVRLKRWMRAMHVDAFFEYCLGHQHDYYTQLSSLSSQAAETRDGVPKEEDLALRALFPEWKPKKGRKRAEARDADDTGTSKRQHLDTPSVSIEESSLAYNPDNFAQSAIPHSAIPWSAFPDDLEQHDSFPMHSALSVSNADGHINQHPLTSRENDLRWRLPGREISPALQYPQSAIMPRYRDSETPVNEPRSAITPSSAEKIHNKRRRGPAVSSAWTGTGAGSGITGKARGRPGGNRITQNGPFSTFPVEGKETDSRESNTAPGYTDPVHPAAVDKNGEGVAPRAPLNPSGLAPPFQPLSTRPARLQLQVPRNSGGPVRLATPPTVLVNGESGTSSPRAGPRENPIEILGNEQSTNHRPFGPSHANDGTLYDIDFTLADVVDALSVEIHGANLLNRPSPLSLVESRSIADAVVKRVQAVCAPGLPPSVVAIYCAVSLGVGYKLGLGGYPLGMLSVKAYPETLVSGSHESVSTPESSSTGNERTPQARPELHYTLSYDLFPCTTVHVGIRHSTCNPDTGQRQEPQRPETRTNYMAEDHDSDDHILDEPAPETVWKQRYLSLRKQNRKRDVALGKYKKSILEAVMAEI